VGLSGLDNGYFDQFNRSNVDVVDLRENPISSIVSNGEFHHHDIIIPAIGFTTVIDNLKSLGLKDTDGVSLESIWADGVRTYLGIMHRGFPNLCMVCGPQSPSEQSNLPTCIETQLTWIAEVMDRMETEGLAAIRPSSEAMEAWNTKVYTAFKKDFYGSVSCRYTTSEEPFYFNGGIPNYIKELN
jgi:cation diffusion facilitator CzcD-associated flavoprotein CzcO